MSPARHPRIPVAASVMVGGVLLAGLAGWAGIAVLLGAGPVGLSILTAMVLVPGAVVAMQFALMSPSARRPVMASDDGAPSASAAANGGSMATA